jgi:hypothetical protein
MYFGGNASWRWEIDLNGSRSCPAADCDIRGVEPLSSATMKVVWRFAE